MCVNHTNPFSFLFLLNKLSVLLCVFVDLCVFAFKKNSVLRARVAINQSRDTVTKRAFVHIEYTVYNVYRKCMTSSFMYSYIFHNNFSFIHFKTLAISYWFILLLFAIDKIVHAILLRYLLLFVCLFI